MLVFNEQGEMTSRQKKRESQHGGGSQLTRGDDEAKDEESVLVFPVGKERRWSVKSEGKISMLALRETKSHQYNARLVSRSDPIEHQSIHTECSLPTCSSPYPGCASWLAPGLPAGVAELHAGAVPGPASAARPSVAAATQPVEAAPA